MAKEKKLSIKPLLRPSKNFVNPLGENKSLYVRVTYNRRNSTLRSYSEIRSPNIDKFKYPTELAFNDQRIISGLFQFYKSQSNSDFSLKYLSAEIASPITDPNLIQYTTVKKIDPSDGDFYETSITNHQHLVSPLLNEVSRLRNHEIFKYLEKHKYHSTINSFELSSHHQHNISMLLEVLNETKAKLLEELMEQLYPEIALVEVVKYLCKSGTLEPIKVEKINRHYPYVAVIDINDSSVRSDLFKIFEGAHLARVTEILDIIWEGIIEPAGLELD